MYKYNLIIKRGDLDNSAAEAMVNRELIKRFGPDVSYLITASLDNEVVVIVRGESKRGLQSALGNWFIEPQRALWKERKSSYPVGTLLHYREILPSESIANQLGG